MQNRAQMKESKCAKDILKCANEKRRAHQVGLCISKVRSNKGLQNKPHQQQHVLNQTLGVDVDVDKPVYQRYFVRAIARAIKELK